MANGRGPRAGGGAAPSRAGRRAVLYDPSLIGVRGLRLLPTRGLHCNWHAGARCDGVDSVFPVVLLCTGCCARFMCDLGAASGSRCNVAAYDLDNAIELRRRSCEELN